MVFERFNSIFWQRKSLTTHFFLDVREWREVIWCLSGLYGGSIRRFWRSKRRLFEPMCECSHVMVNNDSSSLVRFSNFFEDFRQTNCGVPLRIDRATLLKCNMTSFFRRNRRPVWKKCLRMPLSHAMSHDDLAISVHARHQCSPKQRLFLDNFHGFRLLTTVVHNWIH